MAYARHYPSHDGYSAATGRILSAFVIAAIAGTYLQFSIGFPFSGFFVPSFALFFVVPQKKRQSEPVLLLGLLGITLYLVVIIRMPPAPAASEQFRSLIQFLMSLAGGLALYRALSVMNPRKVHHLFLGIALFLLFGAILERLGPLRPISDGVRQIFYANSGYLYLGNARDIADHGFIRPKLFASEPSHLGKFFGLFVAIAAVTARDLKRKIYLLIASVIGFITIGSATVLAGMALICLDIARTVGLKRFVRNPVFILFIISFVATAGWYVYSQTLTRLGLGGEPVEASAYIRLVKPWIILRDALTVHPLLGFGIGAESTLKQISFLASFSDFAPLYIRKEAYDNFAYGNVNFTTFTQLGIVGGVVWFFLLARLQSVLAPHKALEFWVFYAIYGFFIGPLNTPFLWMPLFLVLLALSPRMQPHDQDRARPPKWGTSP